jgi:hypothetical protein
MSADVYKSFFNGQIDLMRAVTGQRQKAGTVGYEIPGSGPILNRSDYGQGVHRIVPRTSSPGGDGIVDGIVDFNHFGET